MKFSSLRVDQVDCRGRFRLNDYSIDNQQNNRRCNISYDLTSQLDRHSSTFALQEPLLTWLEATYYYLLLREGNAIRLTAGLV